MRGDDGSVAVAMSGLVAVIAVLGVTVTSMGLAYSARAQATNAADAAALAAAVATYPPAATAEPTAAARDMARRNGAELISCSCPIDGGLGLRTVEVVTGVGIDVPIFGMLTVEAAARAEFDPRLWIDR